MLTEEEKLRYLQESEPLIRYEAWRFCSKFRGLFDPEDVRQECRLFLWRTLDGYDPSKSKLSTYFSRFIRYKLHNRFFLRHENTLYAAPVDPEWLPEMLSGEPDLYLFEYTELLDQLKPREKQALELTALQGLTQTEAARRMGISQTAVKDNLRRAREKLQDLLKDPQ